MADSLDKLTIRGFKSIRELKDFEMKNLNIFVGANGAGKSNLISFFQMLKAQAANSLRLYMVDNGGVGDILHHGREITKKIEFETYFGSNLYRFSIVSGAGEKYDLIESTPLHAAEDAKDNELLAVREENETYINEGVMKSIYKFIDSWKVYHFQDTGITAAMRHSEIVQDNKYLRPNASNLAPYLLRLSREAPYEYGRILSACRIVAPFIEDFILEPEQFGPKTKVSLAWKAKGSDYPMQAYHLSDGTIRFICLATALLQPNLPSMIIIDEPELGLHPTAIHILNEFIERAAKLTQVVVATQSPSLLDYFAIEDIVVVKRKDGQSTFERLKYGDFNVWLEEYTVGELWLKNVIQGDTTHEP